MSTIPNLRIRHPQMRKQLPSLPLQQIIDDIHALKVQPSPTAMPIEYNPPTPVLPADVQVGHQPLPDRGREWLSGSQGLVQVHDGCVEDPGVLAQHVVERRGVVHHEATAVGVED